MTTVIASPTYSLNGWMGNATDDYGVTWVVTDESGWSDGAPIRMTAVDREGTDGGRSGPPLLGARLITLKGKAVAPNRLLMLAAKDRLHAQVLGDRVAMPLVVAEAHLTRQAMVKPFVEPKAKDGGSTRFDFEIGLRADDPLRYSVDPVTRMMTLPSDSQSGLTFPLTFPLTFGAPGQNSDTGVLCTNDGNAEVLPALTIAGPVVNPSVQNVTTNRVTALGISLADSEFLVIDFTARTVLLNGTANRRRSLLPTSTWWALAPGVNEIRFRAAGYTPATASITYRSGWK